MGVADVVPVGVAVDFIPVIEIVRLELGQGFCSPGAVAGQPGDDRGLLHDLYAYDIAGIIVAHIGNQDHVADPFIEAIPHLKAVYALIADLFRHICQGIGGSAQRQSPRIRNKAAAVARKGRRNFVVLRIGGIELAGVVVDAVHKARHGYGIAHIAGVNGLAVRDTSVSGSGFKYPPIVPLPAGFDGSPLYLMELARPLDYVYLPLRKCRGAKTAVYIFRRLITCGHEAYAGILGVGLTNIANMRLVIKAEKGNHVYAAVYIKMFHIP